MFSGGIKRDQWYETGQGPLATGLAVVNPAHHEWFSGGQTFWPIRQTRVQSCGQKINVENFAENNENNKDVRTSTVFFEEGQVTFTKNGNFWKCSLWRTVN